jgi:plastocyanin
LVLSLATKSLLGFGVALFVASVAYGQATQEASGTVVLAFAAAGAIALAAASVSSGPDRPPAPSGSSDAASSVQVQPAGGRPLFPSIWPLAAGIAMAVAVVGAATSGVVVVVAIVVAVAVLVGWLLQAWSEHPIFTRRFGARLTDRFLVPLGLPAAVFALVATIALSLSRVLLAAPEVGSRVIAIVVAAVILGGAFFVVSQERMARAALSILSAVALVALVAAGAVGLAHGERTFEKKGAAPEAAPVNISAKDTNSFNTDTLTFPAGRTVPLVFDNETASTPHDVAIYDKQGGTELFKGALITGIAQVTYQVKALAAGTYFFQCDVHPNMHGTLNVVAAAAAPSGAAASGGAVSGGAVPTTTAPSPTSTSLEVTAGFATTATTAPTGSPTTVPTTAAPSSSSTSTP